MPADPSPNFDALRLALGRLRHERKMSFDELERRSGVARSSLIWLEQGKQKGSLTTWWRVARGLEVPLGELVSHLDDAGTGAENGVAEV